jgi:hypothetical protein
LGFSSKSVHPVNANATEIIIKRLIIFFIFSFF